MGDKIRQVFRTFPLWLKYFQNDWHKQTVNYLNLRYPQIASKVSECFRYVDLDPENKDVFSYEFSSIIRDIGGVFSSTLDTFLTGVNFPKDKKYYNITHFSDFRARAVYHSAVIKQITLLYM
jgi:hypothetical protein